MELSKIRYKKVYGHLSGTLDFEEGENFLVGINGCGKTTILNLIKWILGPSLPDLCTLDHEFIILDLKHGDYLYSIESRIHETEHELKLDTEDKSRDFKPIKTPLHVHPRKARSSSHSRNIRETYQQLMPEPHEVSAWKFLWEELPSPMFVGLGRHIEDTPFPTQRRPYGERARPAEGKPPRLTATELMRDSFNTARRQLVEINDELNRKVLELSFSGIIRFDDLSKSGATEGIHDKICQLKKKFTESSEKGEYSKALSFKDVQSAIVKYLEELEGLLTLTDNSEKVELALMLNRQNFERTAKMFDLFEEHEDRAHEVQKEMDTFIAVVNGFICDSGKHIFFDNDTGSPFFKSNEDEGRMTLAELSSGEAQVVILLSYFAFLAKTGVPIIIDEPELSLHVEWQKQFVDAVKRVLPDGCQTLMATHSPEICGASEVNVQSLSVRSNL